MSLVSFSIVSRLVSLLFFVLLMTPEILFTILMLVVAIGLFASERRPNLLNSGPDLAN